nr:hypothetical protein [Tanacetum cinerariifolium]GEW98961.1 hypothetical protein [Tanacetum cinerariifolium]
AKIDVDYQLAERQQAQEQEELSDAKKDTLFVQLLEKRRKYFAAKITEEKRNKPPTQAQQRKIMCTYLKNMKGNILKQLKSFDFDKIKKMFDKALKRVNIFKDFRTELVQGKEKRAREEKVEERIKKQNVEDDKETSKLKQLMEIIQNKEEVAIDAIYLAVKSPKIVHRKIYKEEKKSYYQIERADGKTNMYMVFSKMLEIFDREDLEDLYKLVKARFRSIRPMEDLDLLLWDDLKTMFEPHVEDAIWKKQQGYKVLEWKLYDSCGVHSLRMQSMQVFMLVEKTYPLTPPKLTMMLEKKLQSDYYSKMASQLLKLIIKQLKKGHQFFTDFIILENINEFVEKGLTEVLFGQHLKEHVGIVEDRVNGVLCDKDKSWGIHHPYQKIQGFYQGCLELGSSSYEATLETSSTRNVVVDVRIWQQLWRNIHGYAVTY